MASMPGFLTDWPWTPLGNFKYVILAPGAIHSTYLWLTRSSSYDLGYLLVFPFLLSRMIHNQLWISYSRYRTGTAKNLIVDRSIDFEQVDRERNWDDQIILNGILFYLGIWLTTSYTTNLPLYNQTGILLTALIHTGPVEFLYYWLHRALHHHYLYTRYHSHHHSSIVTEPITSVIHPFGEHIAYFLLFAIPIVYTGVTRTASIISLCGYITYIDLMNNMGHCNFEHVPNWIFTVFPPLKMIMYTPSYHSLHHTKFRTNYCLFMPFYDYVYGTMDRSSDELYRKSLKKVDDDDDEDGYINTDVVYLTHFTTAQSMYQSRIGFAGLASEPLSEKWYLWFMWPITMWWMMITWLYGNTFVLDRITFDKFKMQAWAIPRYIIHYSLKWQRLTINNLIEQAILDAEKRNIKVLTLGLLNQGEELNRNGEIYIQKYPKLKLRLVDGTSLAAAVILNSAIPIGTTSILLRGKLTKLAYTLAVQLCHRGVKLTVIKEDEYEKLKLALKPNHRNKLVLSKSNSSSNHKIWLVGDGLEDGEQSKVSKGTTFIPFSHFPPKNMRKDCYYHNTPALLTPNSIGNLHSCENWLPRKAMSAWRVAGIIHVIEGWNVHECGDTIFDIDKVWNAALNHGFRPLSSTPK